MKLAAKRVRLRRSAPVALVLAVALMAAPAWRGAGASRSSGGRTAPIEWSATSPRINLTHIFHGGINRRGKAVGFHSRPGGADPPVARVVRVLRSPNRFGVYEAMVEIAPPAGWQDQRWVGKRSTFYPDRLDRAAVVAAIVHAWQHRGGGAGGGSELFRGPSGLGFTIEGYLLDDGSINTAYPIY